jgi:EAL domain-containing protein (putative c-di-GMP-specific phosphodiesterase class I)
VVAEPTQTLAARQVDIELDSILLQRSVTAHFQPIVSMRERAVLAVEALTRGVHPETGLLIPPALLFGLATPDNGLLELDRLCRQNCLQSFSNQGGAISNLMLSLNMEASLLDQGVLGSNYLVNAVRSLDLDPNRIVIEIVESRVRDTKALKAFAREYKRFGFLIALDDVGAGYSDLARIPAIEPDLIKIDRGLIKGMDKNLHKKEIVRAIINLSHRIGALTVAEGVEREGEVICAMDLGADLLQGYYFSRPMPLLRGLDQACEEGIITAANSYAAQKQGNIKNQRATYQQFEQVADHLAGQLGWAAPHEFQRVLDELIGLNNSLECLFVLNHKGIQVTETVFNPYRLALRRKSLFKPAPIGSDQSLKDYYFMARTERRKYITEPYISMASGLKCITIATSFKDQTGSEHILCCDFAQQPDQECSA